jgi:hypothetical protein
MFGLKVVLAKLQTVDLGGTQTKYTENKLPNSLCYYNWLPMLITYLEISFPCPEKTSRTL